jgi:cytochrome b561
MGLLNSRHGYGALTKILHWAIVVLFAFQYAGATMMLRTEDGATTLGLSQATYFNWHKSLGLIVLVLAVVRIINRSAGELPPWAATLSPFEQKLIHRIEPLLYGAMLVMPASGYLYTMAGGYGVMLFGAFELPNPIGTSPSLAGVARFIHVATAFALLLPLGAHFGIVVGHQYLEKDGLIRRMLPRGRGN